MAYSNDGGNSAEVVRLATLKRKNGEEELRISVDEFRPAGSAGNPKRYLSLRIWYLAGPDQWAPTKKGITVRLGELDEVLGALKNSVDKLTETALRPQSAAVAAQAQSGRVWQPPPKPAAPPMQQTTLGQGDPEDIPF